MGFLVWLSSSHYTASKKSKLLSLYNDTVMRGKKISRRDCVVKCFIKNEAYPTYKNPRAILARVDDFKVRVAPFIKVVEELVYSLCSAQGIKYFIKTVPVPDRAKLICEVIGHQCGFVDPDTAHLHLQRYLVTDYTSFEASFVRAIMNICEFALYRHVHKLFFDGSYDFSDLECIMSENYCVFRHYIFKLVARRMSGEMNTSVGNGFSNLMLTKFILHEFGCKHVRMFVEGDDCIVSYVGPMLPEGFSAKLGFRVKMVYVPRPNLASFCGQVFDYQHFRVICDPIKVVLNFSWVNMAYANCPSLWRGLARSRALSLIYQYPGCPIVQPFALRILHLTDDVDPVIDLTTTRYWQLLLADAIADSRVLLPIENSTRELMFDVFGISVVKQLLLEDFFSRMPFEPYSHPSILEFCTFDQLHYYSHYVC